MRKISAWWIVLTFFVLTVTSWAINELPNLLVDEITINANTISASSTLTVTATGTMSQTVSGAYNITADGSMAHRVGGNYSEVRVGTASSDIYGNSLFRLGGNYSSITVGTASSNIYSHKNENIGGSYSSEIVGSSSVRVAGSDVRAVVGTRSLTITGSDNRSVAGSIIDAIVGSITRTIGGNYTRIVTGTMSTNVGSNYNAVVLGTMSTDISGNINLLGRIATASFNGAVTIQPQGDLKILTGDSGDIILSDQLVVGASTNPRGSAIAEFVSGGAKALGLPVLTEAERDALVNPLMGMFAYIRSSSLLNYYNGTAWTELDTAANVPTVTAWTAYTPTFHGFGTVAGSSFQWRRVGDSLEVRGYWVNGTVAASTAYIGLPSVTMDVAAMGGSMKQVLGYGFLNSVTGAAGIPATDKGPLAIIYDGVSATSMAFSEIEDTDFGGVWQPALGNAITQTGASNVLILHGTPISGWTCCN